MLRFATWKLASVLALVAAAVLVILPSFMPVQTVDALAARLPSFIPLRQLVLGLDLQGGAYLLMEVDTASVLFFTCPHFRPWCPGVPGVGILPA